MYLKYDKKLILEIDKLNFSTNKKIKKEQKEENNLYDTLSNIPFILKTFKKIDIERLKIGDNEFTFILNEKYIYLDNNDLNLSSTLSFAGSQVIMDVDSLYFKDYGITFFGTTKLDTSKEIMNFFGSYNYKNIDGEINTQIEDDILDFYINTTNTIKSIAFLKNFFRLDSVAEAWMYDNVTGDIKLNYLYGKVDLDKMTLLEKDLKGNVTIDDANIRFNKRAKVVKTPKLTIDFENDTLNFSLLNPKYNGDSIDGSRVYIEHLTSLNNGLVVVDLKTNTILNENILEILNAFDIKLPLRQLDGETNSSLVLKIPYLAKKKMSVDGEFYVKNANMKLNNFKFFAKDAKVVLKDNIVNIVDSNLSHKDMLSTNLKLKIDTKKSDASGTALISEFKIDSKNKSIIKLNNFKTDLAINFKDKTVINLLDLDTLLNITNQQVDVKINDLKDIYKFSDILKQSDIKTGNLNLNIYDENDIKFLLEINSIDYPIYKDGKKIDSLKLQGIVNKNKTILFTEDKDIQIELVGANTPLIKLKNYDLDISNTKNKENKNKENKNRDLPNIDIYLENSDITLDKNHNYEANWAKISVKDKKIEFSADAIGLDLPISKNGKKISQLEIEGSYINNHIKINSSNKKLYLDYDINNEKISMKLDDYDVIYNTKDETDESNTTSYYINGINSNIIINKKHIARAKKYSFIFENFKTKIDLTNENTTFEYYKSFDGTIKVDAKNMNDKFLNSLFGKDLIEGGLVNINASGKDGIISGEAYINDSKVKDLAILNNLLILVNTSPGLINPLLAIPSVVGMATNEGFNLNGYKITKGKIDFTYNIDDKFLNMNKIFTKGNGIDFDGFTTIDFKTSKVNSELKMIFFKNYSNIVGSIPVVNYILLGDENKVSTKVKIFGTLEEPEYKTELVKEGIKAPYNFLKRIITSPLKLFESKDGKKE